MSIQTTPCPTALKAESPQCPCPTPKPTRQMNSLALCKQSGSVDINVSGSAQVPLYMLRFPIERAQRPILASSPPATGRSSLRAAATSQTQWHTPDKFCVHQTVAHSSTHQTNSAHTKQSYIKQQAVRHDSTHHDALSAPSSRTQQHIP